MGSLDKPAWTSVRQWVSPLLFTLILSVNSEINVYSEKSESQMGFEPTTLHDLIGCSNH